MMPVSWQPVGYLVLVAVLVIILIVWALPGVPDVERVQLMLTEPLFSTELD